MSVSNKMISFTFLSTLKYFHQHKKTFNYNVSIKQNDIVHLPVNFEIFRLK